jgi:hypothetical protein
MSGGYYGAGEFERFDFSINNQQLFSRLLYILFILGNSFSEATCEERMAEPTYEELKARLSQLEKEVEVKKRSGELSFKVGDKGGVSVYGLGRFPVTLYYEQWNRLLGAAEDIRKFLEENKSRLKLKES